MARTSQEEILWRFQIIAPLIYVSAPPEVVEREILHLSQLPHEHPRRGTVHLRSETIEAWLSAYGREGLQGLRPRAGKNGGGGRRTQDEEARR